MLWAVLIIFVSVGGGTLLAFLPRGRDLWMGPVRTFALTAALSVVVLHLLPEAMSRVGAWAGVLFLAGLFTPGALGKVGAFLWRYQKGKHEGDTGYRSRVALEASYVGLLVHRVGDGAGLGVFTGELHAWSGSQGVVTAMAAHAVPIVAIVVLTYDSLRGRDAALVRAAGLGVASLVGVFMAYALPGHSVALMSPWIAAFVAGMLLHVVSHDLELQLPKTAASRSIDLLAGVLGIAVSLLGDGAHGHHENHGVAHFLEAFWGTTQKLAPFFFLGLVATASLAELSRRKPSLIPSWLPALDGVSKRSAWSPGVRTFDFVWVFLAAQEVGLIALAVSVRFLGWELSLVRFFGALLIALVVGFSVALPFKKARSNEEGASGLRVPPEPTPFWSGFLSSFDELLQRYGAWMIVGLVAAALIDATLPVLPVGEDSLGLQHVLILTLLVVPAHVCAPSAVLVAAALVAKGLSPGGALLALVLGSASNMASNGETRRVLGGRGVLGGVAFSAMISWAVAHTVDRLQHLDIPHRGLTNQLPDGGGALSALFAIIAAAILLRAIFRVGFRGFFAPLHGEHDHSPVLLQGPDSPVGSAG